jgi:probable F420-dependent oxidoreductase
MLDFGICFSADPPPTRMVELTSAAEDAGFDYAWAWDSHVLWQDIYPIFTLMAAATSRIRMGPCVTNPATRDPTVTASALATLNDISGNRMEMGIGRGDSARRVIGQPPVTIERLEWAARLIKDLAEGRPVSYDGTETQLKWAKGTLPVWIAAYGPRALKLAGRIGDGVVLQLADPHVISWLLRWVREGAEEAGRSFEDIKVMAAAPAYVSGDIEHARGQVRWFPALVSNHVVDLVNRYRPDELPDELTAYVQTRDHYDYADHGRVGADHASFVSDEVVDRFCVIGTPEECERKLRELEAVGVHQFNIYSMVDDPEGVIRAFGKELIPTLGAGRQQGGRE